MARRRLAIENASIVTAGNVGTVIVGGDVVKRDGSMVGVDPARVRDQVESSRGYVRGWADEHGGILPQPRIELGF